MEALRDARRHLGRGRYDEALVLLWNAVEPARLAGDRRALRTIEGLATHVARGGDDAQRREAERLLEVLREQAMPASAVAATAQLDADVSPEGREMAGEIEDEMSSDDAVEERGRGARIGNILWLLIVIAVIVVNVLEQAR
jgi:hypothetical protein